MTVTFNRAHLAQVSATALANHDKAKSRQQGAIEVWKIERATKHRVNYRERTIRLRNMLTSALKANKTPTRQEARDYVGISDIENLFYTPPNDYDVQRDVPKADGLLSPAEVTEIRALQAVLDAAAGDTITANELKLLGLKNLAPVFIAAAAEPATPPKRKR